MKQHAPATERNREPILAVLRQHLPASGTVLEIAAGSGEHAVFLSGHFPGLWWQPTDADPAALASIAAWRDEISHPNLLAPLPLDSTAEHWPVERADVVVNINMVHIAPWAACEGLFAGIDRTLAPGGIVYLYGPFNVDGTFTAPSNETFDRFLRSRDPAWGIRDIAAVQREAERRGLAMVDRVPMPANNFSLIFRRP